MRSQTTCSVSLFSSVHILTVVGLRGAGLRGAGLSKVDCILVSDCLLNRGPYKNINTFV